MNKTRNHKIKVFYTDKMVNTDPSIINGCSRSPLKPMLLMKALEGLGISKHLEIESDFAPFEKDDFKIAHTEEYVEAFFNGIEPLCSSNMLPWSKELAESVRYTNASLYEALRHSILNPSQVSHSFSSGYHHARPSGGSGFCTFSGQVVSSVKLHKEFCVSMAMLDLDGHYGNSIENSRKFVPELDSAIPKQYHFPQLRGQNLSYYHSLVRALDKIEAAVIENKIHYVLWAHGADSHEQDDLGGQVDTNYWVKCSEAFYSWVKKMDEKLAALGRPPLPITLCLFGGYRKDNYASVLSLHIKDISVCLNELCGQSVNYEVNVAEPSNHTEEWVNGMPVSLLKMLALNS